MLRSARQATILKALGQQGACKVNELAEQLAVSDETIRRDVKAMAGKGLVERVHGGVMLPHALSEPAFQKRMGRNAEEKQRIARLAAAQIRNGDSVMLDTGSTTAYVARALGEHRNLSVVTNCTEIARTLAREASNRVHLCGGALRADDWATFGSAAIDFVRQFHVNYAILSIGGVTDSGAFMDYHLEEAEFSRAVIAQAKKTIVVADHSKFGNSNFIKVCDFDQVDMVVVDQPPPATITAGFDEAGVVVIDAQERQTE